MESLPILSMSLEFPELGKHCQYPNCHTLDFLPFTCASCEQYYCKKHRTTSDHECKQQTERHSTPSSKNIISKQVKCPLCRTMLSLETNQDPNHIVNAHISRGCRKEASKSCAVVPAGRCAKCNRKELLPATCRRCHQNYCVKHRFFDAHGCEPSLIKVS